MASHTSPLEKAEELTTLMPVAPQVYPASQVQIYPTVYPHPVHVSPQDRPRNARKRRFLHLLACTLVFFGAIRLFFAGDIRNLLSVSALAMTSVHV